LVIGHSEGGLAALAVDERRGLAPKDLHYLGAVVAAPSAQLGKVAPAIFAIEGRGYGALRLEAVAEVAPDLAPSVALGPQAAAREPLLTHGCWEEAVPGFDDIPPEEMLADPAIGRRLAEVLTSWAGSDPAGAADGGRLVAKLEVKHRAGAAEHAPRTLTARHDPHVVHPAGPAVLLHAAEPGALLGRGGGVAHHHAAGDAQADGGGSGRWGRQSPARVRRRPVSRRSS
jgi:hypothetical protein